jgi:hypothetical protein
LPHRMRSRKRAWSGSAVGEMPLHPGPAEAVRMTERRRPEREVAEEHRRLTREQERGIEALVLFWIVPAALLLSLITIIASRC